MEKTENFTPNIPKIRPSGIEKSGLHDASIIGVEPHEFPFDYNKYTATLTKNKE